MDMNLLADRLRNVSKFGGYKTYEQVRNIIREYGIEVVCTGGSHLGRCYEASYYEVISNEELTSEVIDLLRHAGVLGYGQEFWVEKPIQRNGKFVVKAESRVDSSD